MPADPEAVLEEARREAHNRCPSANIVTYECGERQACSWSGHKSIDRLVAVARLVGELKAIDFAIKESPADILYRERDRLLAELKAIG